MLCFLHDPHPAPIHLQINDDSNEISLPMVERKKSRDQVSRGRATTELPRVQSPMKRFSLPVDPADMMNG